MNVLYLINHAGSGGAEKYVLELARAFLLQDIGRAYFIYNEDGPLRQRMEKLGVPVFRVAMNGPFDVVAARKIARYCAENKIHIIHTQFAREMYVSVLAKIFSGRLRVIYTSHINLKNSGARKITNYFICKKVDGIIAVCDLGRRLLIENKMPAAKIRLIYNGVEPVGYSRDDDVRKELGIPAGRVVFVTLTRIMPEKGPMFLLESVKKLAGKTDLPFAVIMAGRGDGFNEARQFVDEFLKGIVFLTGYRKDSDKLLAASDVFVNSSQSEALSYAIIEAMARGLPVIATDVGGNPEIVNDETQCGTLVGFGDTDAMSEAMLRYLTDEGLRKRQGENALAAVKTTFSKDRQAADTFDIYNKNI